ncbi:MAG: HAD family hydrolase [Nocardioides sp.]
MTDHLAPAIDTVVLDLDGTLVDSAYVHALAWKAAFRDVGVDVATHRLHRAIGMGGDRLVAHVAGERVESAVGDAVRDAHLRHLEDRFHEIVPTDGAAELLEGLRARQVTLVLASSSDEKLTSRLLGVVDGAEQLFHAIVTGSEPGESKPSGDLVEQALAGVEGQRALMVGDAVWDARAAAEAGVPCVALLSGGFCEAELRKAGAVGVFSDPRDLLEHLDDVLTGHKHPKG